MQQSHQENLLSQFMRNQAGESPTRLALMFAAVTVFGTVLIMPLINSATQKIVQNGLGVDPMTTASTNRPEKKYIIRKSVLNQKTSVICLKGRHEGCEDIKN